MYFHRQNGVCGCVLSITLVPIFVSLITLRGGWGVAKRRGGEVSRGEQKGNAGYHETHTLEEIL